MSDYAYCSTCSTYHYGEKHLPEFRVGDAGDDPEDYGTYRARSANEAATKYGEISDDGGDHAIVGGLSALVIVIDAQGNQSKWRVSGEAVPQYRTKRLIKEGEATT